MGLVDHKSHLVLLDSVLFLILEYLKPNNKLTDSWTRLFGFKIQDSTVNSQPKRHFGNFLNPYLVYAPAPAADDARSNLSSRQHLPTLYITILVPNPNSANRGLY